MKTKLLFLFSLVFGVLLTINGQETLQRSHTGNWKDGAAKLGKAYPQTISEYEDGFIILKNGNKIKYTESTGSKTATQLLESNDMGDIFAYPYPKGELKGIVKNQDPGRIRNEELLKKMYGSTAKEVEANLVTITWCAKLWNQKIRVTRINNVDKQLQKISDELDQHPELKDYLSNSGVYLWRKISGTDRLSSHSFGTAIDIAVKYANYWQWDCRCKTEEVDLKHRNKIPQLIVDIFEKHGFIWGGKWYHYDTMHFEYRPELLIQ